MARQSVPGKAARATKRKRDISRSPSPDSTGTPALAPKSNGPEKKPKQQPTSHKASTGQPVRIPDRLKNVIHESKHGFFELTFPIGHLDGLQRLAWGIDARTESIFVCVKFGPKNDMNSDHVLFCVHSRTDDEGPRLRSRHHFCSTKSHSDHSITKPCTSRSNIMTCLLSRELHKLLGPLGCRKLDLIYESISTITKSMDPTTSCLICDKKFDVKIYTPTACLGKCLAKFEQWPLRARLSHLLTDAKSLDFLLCSIYTAVRGQEAVPGAYGTDRSLLVDCPLELAQVQPAIDSLPPISDQLSMKDLLQEGKNKTLSTHRRKLLSWLPQRFRGCMVSLKPDAEHLLRGKNLGQCHQFLFLNSRHERHAKFTRKIKKVKVGSVAFHGCPASRTFNILCDALRDPSSLPYTRSDVGVFFSDDPNYSTTYSQKELPLIVWKGSQFFTPASGQQSPWLALFGIEVASPIVHYHYSESSTRDESLLMIRYILLVPRIAYGPSSYLAIDQKFMATVYKTLDGTELTARHVGLLKAQEQKSADVKV